MKTWLFDVQFGEVFVQILLRLAEFVGQVNILSPDLFALSFLFAELFHVPGVEIGVAVDGAHVLASAVLIFADALPFGVQIGLIRTTETD